MDIISRKEWGARAPRSRSTVSWGTRSEFVVHYSEGPTTQTVRSIQDFHMDGNGWSDVGYNFLVDVHGRIYEGRGWLTVGAHAPGHNSSGIGVCMIGRDGDATAAAMRSIRAVYDEAVRRKGGGLKKLGHRDVYATSCPGDQLYHWVRAGMPASGGGAAASIEEDDVIGLKVGDKGEGVKALQQLIVFAGQEKALGASRVDGDYGKATAEALRLVRKFMGSAAKDGYGNEVTGIAYAQLVAAVARKQGR